jgi:hypothetical protein
MSSLKHIQFLKQLITEDNEETAKVVAAYSKMHGNWHMEISDEAVAMVANMVSEIVPLSKSYDEVAALAAIFLAKHNSLEDVPPGILSYIGLELDGEDKLKLNVTDSESFWKHFNTILTNDVTLIQKDPVVVYLYSKPSLINEKKSIIQIFTDPGTDSNLDDEKCCVYIEVMRNYLELWNHARYLITAKGGLLDRQSRLYNLISNLSEDHTYTIDIYGDLNEVVDGKSTRFYAPYSAKLHYAETDLVRKSKFEDSDITLSKTDTILWIGQVGSCLGKKLVEHSSEDPSLSESTDDKVRCCVIQGPGFNTMGSDWNSIKTIGKSFAYVDTNGAAKVNHEQSLKQLQLIDLIHPDASSYRNNAIWGFMNTDAKFCFQRQFQGFKFSRDYLEILEKLRTHIVDDMLELSPEEDSNKKKSPLPIAKFVDITTGSSN